MAYSFCGIVCLYVLIFIVMTRAVFLGIAIAVSFWMLKNIDSKKIMIVCAVISLCCIFTLTGILDDIVNGSFIGDILGQTVNELNLNRGSISIRSQGLMYYLSMLIYSSPLTGVGLFSSTEFIYNPVTTAAVTFKYYLIDINGVSTIVMLGLNGLLFLVYFNYISIRDTYSIISNVKKYFKFNYEILLLIFIFTISTPTINNIIVERMVIYSGMFFYLIQLSADMDIRVDRLN